MRIRELCKTAVVKIPVEKYDCSMLMLVFWVVTPYGLVGR
jgi:hypothetical protein